MLDDLIATILDPEVAGRQAIEAGLVLQREDPLNAETPITALNGAEITPTAQFYLRNHFPIPVLNPDSWRLTVSGSVEHRLTYGLQDLLAMRSRTQVVTMECAGNNRAAIDPCTPGEQCRLGAVSTAEWTGVPLIEILERANPTARAGSGLPRCRPRTRRRKAGNPQLRPQSEPR